MSRDWPTTGRVPPARLPAAALHACSAASSWAAAFRARMPCARRRPARRGRGRAVRARSIRRAEGRWRRRRRSSALGRDRAARRARRSQPTTRRGRFSGCCRRGLSTPALAGFESRICQSTARFRTWRSAWVASKRSPSGSVVRHAPISSDRRSTTPIVSTACPTNVLPEAPVPEQAMKLTRPPDATTPLADLHAPTTASAHTARSHLLRPNRQRSSHPPAAVSAAAIASAASSTNTRPPEFANPTRGVPSSASLPDRHAARRRCRHHIIGHCAGSAAAAFGSPIRRIADPWLDAAAAVR
jgi:hypothetical protein